jgi:serine/threonine-protein kinase
MISNFPVRYIPEGHPLKGGMGAVLVCKDTNLDRRVVIKYIHDIKDKRRLLDEISALQSIRSKFVVEIFDIIVDTATNDIAIVEDYVPGIDLADFAKQKPTGENYLKLLYQISSGICEIHRQGIIHRDIKPNNIKFDQENIIKIFDFGLARKSGVKANTVGFRGTIGFFAPELFTRGAIYFSEAVDTYAFGATAMYIAEGALPKDLLNLPPKLTSNLMSFSSLSVGIPDEIAQLLDRTLMENPNDRPNIELIKDTIAKYLLFGKHSAQIVNVSRGELHKFDSVGKKIGLMATDRCKIEIEYNGLVFNIISVVGDVYINNEMAIPGMPLPGSCVITLGSIQNLRRRIFVTFDISHPEIVL